MTRQNRIHRSRRLSEQYRKELNRLHDMLSGSKPYEHHTLNWWKAWHRRIKQEKWE